MTRRDREEDVDEPQAADLERFGSETMACPKCGAEVYDEAEWCHKCGHVMGEGDRAGPAGWVMVTVAVVVAALLLAALW